MTTADPTEAVERAANEEYPFDHHTWKGADAEAAPEYQAQLSLPVHAVGGQVLGRWDPFSGQPVETGGEPRVWHETVCGLLLGTQLLRTTDDPAEVTCAACQK